MGMDTLFKPEADFGFHSMLGGLLGFPMRVSAPSQTCPLCGSTLEDISRTGRLGCEQCYRTFAPALEPQLKRMYPNVAHAGNIPASAGSELAFRRELEELKRQLKSAVGAQEYEKAAELRDRVKDLERREKK